MTLITTQTMNPRPKRVSMPAPINNPKPTPMHAPPKQKGKR